LTNANFFLSGCAGIFIGMRYLPARENLTMKKAQHAACWKILLCQYNYLSFVEFLMGCMVTHYILQLIENFLHDQSITKLYRLLIPGIKVVDMVNTTLVHVFKIIRNNIGQSFCIDDQVSVELLPDLVILGPCFIF
jgi:hypothetical protein